MSLHTSWKVGGAADYFVEPADLEEVASVLCLCSAQELPLFIFGNGTNLLVREGGIRGVVLKIGGSFNYIRWDGAIARAGSGTPVSLLAREAARQGLEGLEFAGGIPGTLGGALVMNAGAFGSYTGNTVETVKVVDFQGRLRLLNREECRFEYRSSCLSRTGVVVEAMLKLKRGDPLLLEQRMESFLSERLSRHPQQPSAGSVFRNPPGRSAGELIEAAGGKGLRSGFAQVSEKHANFILNLGGATASDIIILMTTVQKLVWEKFKIELCPEVRIVGEES